MSWLQLVWLSIQVLLVILILSAGFTFLVSGFFFLRMLWRERFSTHEYELDDDDGLLVFDYSKDDPWTCGRCGREFENRRDYNEPRKHYQYHHRGSVRMEEI